MSRAQKNVRLSIGSPAKESGSAVGRPADLTMKDGADNSSAGDVNNFTAADFDGMVQTKECCD